MTYGCLTIPLRPLEKAKRQSREKKREKSKTKISIEKALLLFTWVVDFPQESILPRKNYSYGIYLWKDRDRS